MVNKKKKGTSGNAKNFITRTQAVRKLQISLPDFRRLCIFKGIYPREPRNRRKASKSSTPSTTFYYAKDIQYLLHEPLINKFREHKALAKKIGRALGRGEADDAARLERNQRRMTLDHIIKERYPTFVDALRDLDDALSMLFLFANLPSTTYVAPRTIALCQRLCLEFEHYLIVTHSLRKSFLSIKGIYYQATIQGQDILWLVPYRFVQKMQGDIDFRIMSTFIEFYTTLLGFVNYRLYTSVGLVYPPKFNATSDDLGGELGAFKLEGRGAATETIPPESASNGHSETKALASSAQQEADKLAKLGRVSAEELPEGDEDEALDNEATEVTEGFDKFEPTVATQADVLPQPEPSRNVAATLFAPFTFFLSRETPRAPLEFILKAFGCKRVGWDAVLGDGAFTTDENDSSITHQVVDRPNLPANAFSEPTVDNGDDQSEPGSAVSSRMRVAGRIYVQPQWIWDCINQGKLLRPDLYAPGANLPPHLSPWVKPKKGDYDPTIPLADQEKEDEAQLHEEDFEAEELERETDEEAEALRTATNGEYTESMSDQDDGVEAEEETAQSENASSDDDGDLAGVQRNVPVSDDWEGFGEEHDGMSDTEVEALKHQRELEAEAMGAPYNTASAGETPGKALSEARRKAERRKMEEQEELDRRRMMLPNKKRRLFDSMSYSNRQKDAAAEKLRKKRRKLERQAPQGA